jgi:hypothetical protein
MWWLTSPFLWAVNSAQPVSAVVYVARTSASALAINPVAASNGSQATMVVTLALTGCAVSTCEPQCALWSEEGAMWLNDSAAIGSSAAYRNAAGQRMLDCIAYDAAVATVAILPQPAVPSIVASSTAACASSSPSFSASSSSHTSRSSSSEWSSFSSAAATNEWPAGSVQVSSHCWWPMQRSHSQPASGST